MKVFEILRPWVILGFCQVLLSCSSITFVQVEQEGEHQTHKRWHHATMNGMVEVSRPLDIQGICHSRAWTKITTEHTQYNWLAEVLIPGVEGLIFYSAWTNNVQCHEPVIGLIEE